MGDPDAMAEPKEGKIEGSEAYLTLHLLNPSLLEKEKLTFFTDGWKSLGRQCGEKFQVVGCCGRVVLEKGKSPP